MPALNTTPRLQRQLLQLEQADLIRLAAAQPEIEYAFRHALTQESAYHTLVRVDRRHVHRVVGEAIEALYAGAELPAALAPVLARHFEEAADDARALRYYRLAGDHALSRNAIVEAMTDYSRALAAAGRSAAGTDTAIWQHLFTARGRALELSSQFDDALRNYQAMASRAQELGDRPLALSASVAICQLYATPTPLFDPPRAERLVESTLAEARALGDEASEARILWNQLNLFRFTERNPQARLVGERSLEIARRLGLSSQTALTLNDLSHVYADLGLWQEARQASQQASLLWRQLNNLAMLADCLSSSSLYRGLRGEFAPALSQAQEAHGLAVSIGNLWGQSYSLSGMTWPYWYTGRLDQAIEVCEACIRVGRAGGYLVAEVFDRVRLAYMYGELGATGLALDLVTQALAGTRYTGDVGLSTTLSTRVHLQLRLADTAAAAATLQTMQSETHGPAIWEVDPILRAQSEVALAGDNAARALEVTRAHVARLRELGLELFLPEALTGQAQALRRLGRLSEARECLDEALGRAQHMPAVMLQWPVLVALGELEAERGDAAEAEAFWSQARAIVREVSSHIPTAELRASFLARPELRQLMS